jgi:hypothetical protein
MNGTAKPLAETTHEAITVLSRELGIVDTVRFLTQFSTGFGNYTRERDSIFRGVTMDEILSEIRRTHRRRPNKRIQPTRKKRARG